MKSIIAWFAKNHVAANLLMLVIIGAGALTLAFNVKQEIFPEFSLDRIVINVPYLGAAPEEVENGVTVRVEEAIQGVEGIKRITSTSAEGMSAVIAELHTYSDSSEALDDIKARVDAIRTFPVEAEEPVIQELTFTRQVVSVAIYGDASEKTLKRLAQKVRDDIAALPNISIAELIAVRPYEISIEVSESALRRFGLTFDAVAEAVRRSSLDLPGGSVRTSGGEILLRTEAQAYDAEQFAALVLKTRPDGTRLSVGDVARVVDGFAETDQSSRFNGQPAAMVQVFRIGDQDALDISATVGRYVEEARLRLPDGIEMATWQDNARILRSRRNLLLKNAFWGFVLVFFVLALFMRFRLAFWVTIGIPISFLGALWVMPAVDASVNMISLFAFILVLGIVVDDAIIVGENIHTHQHRTGEGVNSSILGAQEVAIPVIFAVLTTVAAFVPLLSVPGTTGKFMGVIPVVVIAALAFSLVESLLVLPSHLSRLPRKTTEQRNVATRIWRRFQRVFAQGLERFVEKIYRPTLDLGLKWRYLSVSIAIATLLLTSGVVGAGFVKFVFFPNVEADYVTATLSLPQGTPRESTASAVAILEQSAREVERELEERGHEKVFRHMLASIGDQPIARIQSRNAGNTGSPQVQSHLGELAIELTPSEQRAVSSSEIVALWRERTGLIPDARELAFSGSLFSSGAAVDIQLSGDDLDQLVTAAEQLKERIQEYPGVFDVADSFRAGKQQIELDIKPSAELLGLTRRDLARQVRQAFYGEEVQRIQRAKDEVKVMVRYPEESRRSLGSLEQMRVRTADGREIPFSAVAAMRPGRGFASISRVDRRRAVSVTADVDVTKGNANEIRADLEQKVLPQLSADFPGVFHTFEGQQREQAETIQSLLFKGYPLALLLIFVLMAVPFRSYVQPLIVMSAIPFGLVGAVWGHIIMGLDLTILSMFGLVALAGVVVNDSLVLVDYINRRRWSGVPVPQAVREAGSARFRPVILTSLTTFSGLTPLLLERSVQAQFLIPMAVSLAFGVIFSTVITLVLVPCSYLILEDLVSLFRWRLTQSEATAQTTV